MLKEQKPNNRVDRLHNRHSGRCVIVANGPSLNRMDLRFLKNEAVIGMNKIFLGFKRFGFYPRYYVAVNKKVIAQSAEQISKLNCVKVISDRGGNSVAEDALTYHVRTRGVGERFSKNLSRGLHEGWTVTYAALQLAWYLGFTTVVIIGMDHRFKYTGKPNETRLMEGPDLNHFSADYFSGQHWDNPDLAHSEESYRIAREVFEADGRRIIDATVGGACKVFEKRNYREIFGC